MDTLIWIKLAFIGGILALAALAVAAEVLIDRFLRRRSARPLHDRGITAAPAGGRP